ncbi:MAG: CDP-diacylglycerol--glycerol-3-phosphate 3-phosphatidyltransferase [Rickettsiaceae bacterium]|nr:CDP-diacylglycerol--glycerol-3-phosphate 3-phosphatidyltransferase [Rickettsiaceae bacterium]
MRLTVKSLPNILTMFRIAIIPVLVMSFYVDGFLANIVAASLFLLASITDFFDGYFARSLKAQTNFGRCLDPIADKLLVMVAITMLIHFGDKNMAITIPGLIIICREVLVSGLREFLAGLHVGMPVNKLGKYKTAAQMTAITLLLIGGPGSEYAVGEIFGQGDKNLKLIVADIIVTAGQMLLAIAAFLTVVTGYIYLKIGLKNM